MENKSLHCRLQLKAFIRFLYELLIFYYKHSATLKREDPVRIIQICISVYKICCTYFKLEKLAIDAHVPMYVTTYIHICIHTCIIIYEHYIVV